MRAIDAVSRRRSERSAGGLQRALGALRKAADHSSSHAVRRDDEFVRRFKRLRERGIYESHVFEVADDVYAILPESDLC